MYITQIVSFVLLLVGCCYCATTRIWHHSNSCGKPGFTCLPKIGAKHTIIFECPSKVRSYHIYINEFNGPKSLENLYIRNCETLTVIFRCTKYSWEKKNFKYLEISNIQNLKIQNQQNYQSLLPPSVVFENITRIETIPGNTFTQVNRKANTVRCALPNYNFDVLIFRNVSIDTIQTGAVNLPARFGKLHFVNVNIRKLEHFALRLEQNKQFLIENSTLELVKFSAIEIHKGNTIFSNNKIREIQSNGVFVLFADNFHFTSNQVGGVLRTEALVISSSNVSFTRNYLHHLQPSSLSKVNGLVSYNFSSNDIGILEAASLVPNMETFRSSWTQITIERNTFSCNCSLLLEIYRIDLNTSLFYGMIFDKKSENICRSSCNLPLFETVGKINKKGCSDEHVESICEANKKTTTVSLETILSHSTSNFQTMEQSGTTVLLNSTTEKEILIDKNIDTLIMPSRKPSFSISYSTKNNEVINSTTSESKSNEDQFPLTSPVHNLSKATFLPTTVPPTKLKAASSTEKKENERSTPGQMNFIKESDKADVLPAKKSTFTKNFQSGSKTHYLCYSLLYMLISHYLF